MNQIKARKLIHTIFSIGLLTAICTCVIINAAISKRLSWSILVIDGCVMFGILLIPPLLMKKRGIFYSLCLLTAFIIPFLAVIEAETSGSVKASGWLCGIGIPVSLIWLVFIWILFYLYPKMKKNFWFLIGFCLLLCIPGHILTNYVIDLYMDYTVFSEASSISYISTVVSLLCVSGICFIISSNKRKADQMSE